MHKFIITVLASLTLTAFAAEKESPKLQSTEMVKIENTAQKVDSAPGATWDESATSEKGATWDETNGPVYYLYPSYNNKGEFVRTPAKVFGAIGIIPGSIVGAVVGLPLLPWQTYPTTIHGCNTFFGQGFSMIFGAPFYVVKIIFWDIPASWFN